VDGDAVIFSLEGGSDSALFDLNATSGHLMFQEAPDFEIPDDVDGDNVYEVLVTLSDGNGTTEALAVRIIVSDQDESPWTLSTDLGNGWRGLDWFGFYYDTANGWIYHPGHGWLFKESDDEWSTWLYDETLGWLWTNAYAYPFLYSSTASDWLYYQSGEDGVRWFYRYKDNAGWFSP